MATAKVNNPIFARLFDRFAAKDKGCGEDVLGKELLADLRGRVVGVGNGINFEHYPPTVAELVAVEPEPYLRGVAERAATTASVTITVIDGIADSIPADDEAFDAAVVAGVLCSVPSQRRALSEARRLLRPRGELRFYEHVLSRRPAFARYQRAVSGAWSHAMGGCRPDRDTLTAIESAGFTIERCRGFGFPGHARIYPVTPRVLGRARIA